METSYATTLADLTSGDSHKARPSLALVQWRQGLPCPPSADIGLLARLGFSLGFSSTRPSCAQAAVAAGIRIRSPSELGCS